MRQLGYSVDDLGLGTTPSYLQDPTPAADSKYFSGIKPSSLGSGQLLANLEQLAGTLFNGKTGFDNTQTGYRLGIDTDGTAKFYIGNTTSYVNWDGVTLTIAGTLSATAGTIGGFSIGSDYIRDAADSFGLASTVSGSDDVRFWAGDTFANRATADFRVTEAGAVTASSMTITGGAITGTPIASIPNSTATDISLLGWQHDMAFTASDHDTVAWATGTITLSNGRTFSITGSNTGTMSAITYIYLDTGVSSTALQTTTTASTAAGANKILICVAQNVTSGKSAIFQVFGGKALGGTGVLLTASNVTAQTITTNEIAANTIVGGNISSLSITGKTCLFDTGTVGGWTMGADTLSAGSGSTAVTLSTASTGSDDVRIAAGSSTLTSAPFRVYESGRTVVADLTISRRVIGVATAAELTAAITTLSAGGEIRLAAGTYSITTAQALPSSIRLIGDNASTTTIAFSSTGQFAMTGTNVYTTGTLSVNQGSTSVTGSGTTWTAAMIGRQIFISNRWYVIANRTSNTAITLATAFADANVSGASYRIASVIQDVEFNELTITNTGTADVIDGIDCRDLTFNDVIIVPAGSGSKGIELDNVMSVEGHNLTVAGVPATTSHGIHITNGSFVNFEQTATVSNGGSGMVFDNVKTSTVFKSASNGNTADGYNFTTVSESTFIIEAKGNGGQGVECVSGSDGNLFIPLLSGNTSDGLKLTATSDNNRIISGTITANGGYGINIAASTCDNTVVSSNIFATNSSGAVNDSGTSTQIRGNVGANDNDGVGTADVQEFTADGTWTKPSGAVTVRVQAWGAGGSGANEGATGAASGGGGGEFAEATFDAADLGATVAVTIGTGGAAVATDDTNGNNGEDTTFGAHLTANGGSGGTFHATNDVAGGGGGTPFSTGATGLWGVGVANGAGGVGLYSGAGGGGATGSSPKVGGDSKYGGGGGGGATDGSGGPAAGGASEFGGAGGAGSTTGGGSGTAGTIPGGGGGASQGASGSSGAGANGFMRVTTTF